MASTTKKKASPRLAVLGSGYVGCALVGQALRKGFRVSALTRNPATAEALENRGPINAVCADLASGDWHSRIEPEQDVVVTCVSSAGGGTEGYRRSYVLGMDSVARWLSGGRAGVSVFTGSIGVYPQEDGSVVDESSPAGGHSRYADLLLEAEYRALEQMTGADHRCVLRLAGIYGPGRHYLLDRILAGDARLPGSGEGIMNAVHLDDICRAIWAVIEGARPGTEGVYNVVDDCPERRQAVAEWLAGRLGRPPPGFDADLPGPRAEKRRGRSRNRRISNEKLKRVFSWTPGYPSYRDGYGPILAEMGY